MTDLIDEVSEDLKNEKHDTLVRKFVKIFTTLAVIIIIATAIYAWKERSVEELQHRLSMWFNQAIIAKENNQFEQAIGYFDKVIKYPHQQYAALSYLNKADILFKQNKFEQGQQFLLEMSEQKHFDKSFTDLALVIYLSNQFNNAKETMNKDFIDRISKKDQPWQLAGYKLQALADIKQNNFGAAKAPLEKIVNSANKTQMSAESAEIILSIISQSK